MAEILGLGAIVSLGLHVHLRCGLDVDLARFPRGHDGAAQQIAEPCTLERLGDVAGDGGRATDGRVERRLERVVTALGHGLAIVCLVEQHLHVVALRVVLHAEDVADFRRSHSALLQVHAQVRQLHLRPERWVVHGMHLEDEFRLRVLAGEIGSGGHEVASDDHGRVGLLPTLVEHRTTL